MLMPLSDDSVKSEVESMTKMHLLLCLLCNLVFNSFATLDVVYVEYRML